MSESPKRKLSNRMIVLMVVLILAIIVITAIVAKMWTPPPVPGLDESAGMMQVPAAASNICALVVA